MTWQTGSVSSDDKCLLLDGHAAGHVQDGKEKKMVVWQRRAQTNSWMDGRMDSWWCSTLFTFLFVLFLGVCLSLLPFICSGAEKTRSFPPPEKGPSKTKLTSMKQRSVPQLKMNGVKFTPRAFLPFTSRHATDQSVWLRALPATTLRNRDSADRTGGNASTSHTQTLASTSTIRRRGRTPAVRCVSMLVSGFSASFSTCRPPCGA